METQEPKLYVLREYTRHSKDHELIELFLRILEEDHGIMIQRDNPVRIIKKINSQVDFVLVFRGRVRLFDVMERKSIDDILSLKDLKKFWCFVGEGTPQEVLPNIKNVPHLKSQEEVHQIAESIAARFRETPKNKKGSTFNKSGGSFNNAFSEGFDRVSKNKDRYTDVSGGPASNINNDPFEYDPTHPDSRITPGFQTSDAKQVDPNGYGEANGSGSGKGSGSGAGFGDGSGSDEQEKEHEGGLDGSRPGNSSDNTNKMSNDGKVYLITENTIEQDATYTNMLVRLKSCLEDNHGIFIQESSKSNIKNAFNTKKDWLIVAVCSSLRYIEDDLPDMINMEEIRVFFLIFEGTVSIHGQNKFLSFVNNAPATSYFLHAGQDEKKAIEINEWIISSKKPRNPYDIIPESTNFFVLKVISADYTLLTNVTQGEVNTWSFLSNENDAKNVIRPGDILYLLNHSSYIFGWGIILSDPYLLGYKTIKGYKMNMVDALLQQKFNKSLEIQKSTILEERLSFLKDEGSIQLLSPDETAEFNKTIKSSNCKAPENWIRSEQHNFSQINLISNRKLPRYSDRSVPTLGVESLVQKFAELLAEIDRPAVLGLFGQWGRGKSFFIKQLKQKLEEDDVKDQKAGTGKLRYRVLLFNAWKYQDTEAISAYLHMEILEFYLNGFKRIDRGLISWRIQKLWQTFKLTILSLTYKDLFWGVVILVIFYSLFWQGPSWQDIDWFKTSLGSIVTAIFAKSKKSFEIYTYFISKLTRIKRFGHLLGVQYEIQRELKKILKSAFPKPEKEKLLLVVDDLDRCPEDKILILLDSLRVMMEDEEIQKRIVVLIAVDERILRRAIDNKYTKILSKNVGNTNHDLYSPSSVDPHDLAHEYMDKIFLFGFKLQSITLDERKEFFKNFSFENQYRTLNQIMKNVELIGNSVIKLAEQITSRKSEQVEEVNLAPLISLKDQLDDWYKSYSELKDWASNHKKKEVDGITEQESNDLNDIYNMAQEAVENLQKSSLSTEPSESTSDQIPDQSLGPSISPQAFSSPSKLSLKDTILTPKEERLIQDSFKLMGAVTPRQIKTFYYRYLFAKTLIEFKDISSEDIILFLAALTNIKVRKALGRWVYQGDDSPVEYIVSLLSRKKNDATNGSGTPNDDEGQNFLQLDLDKKIERFKNALNESEIAMCEVLSQEEELKTVWKRWGEMQPEAKHRLLHLIQMFVAY